MIDIELQKTHFNVGALTFSVWRLTDTFDRFSYGFDFASKFRTKVDFFICETIKILFCTYFCFVMKKYEKRRIPSRATTRKPNMAMPACTWGGTEIIILVLDEVLVRWQRGMWASGGGDEGNQSVSAIQSPQPHKSLCYKICFITLSLDRIVKYQDLFVLAVISDVAVDAAEILLAVHNTINTRQDSDGQTFGPQDIIHRHNLVCAYTCKHGIWRRSGRWVIIFKYVRRGTEQKRFGMRSNGAKFFEQKTNINLHQGTEEQYRDQLRYPVRWIRNVFLHFLIST